MKKRILSFTLAIVMIIAIAPSDGYVSALTIWLPGPTTPATAIRPNTDIRGNQFNREDGDLDLYVITLTEPSILSVRLTYSGHGYDFNIFNSDPRIDDDAFFNAIDGFGYYSPRIEHNVVITSNEKAVSAGTYYISINIERSTNSDYILRVISEASSSGPIVITTTYPFIGETDVSRYSFIELTFSHPIFSIDVDGITLHKTEESNHRINLTVELDDLNRNVLRAIPEEPLDETTRYHLLIDPESIVTSNGYFPGLTNNQDFHFTTGTRLRITRPVTFYSRLADPGNRRKVLQIPYEIQFFNKSATIYNHELGIASLALSAAYGLSAAESVLLEYGFPNTTGTKYYNENYSWDSVGHVFASNRIHVNGKPCRLVAIYLSGTRGPFPFGPEWRANFTRGIDSFSAAVDNVQRHLEDYLKEFDQNEHLRFWIVGYSRGAAVGNILGARLTDKYGENDVYSYGFASPATRPAEISNPYINLFTYNNSADNVCTGIPAGRYGTDLWFTSSFLITGFDRTMDQLNERHLLEMGDIFRELTNGKELYYKDLNPTPQKRPGYLQPGDLSSSERNMFVFANRR